VPRPPLKRRDFPVPMRWPPRRQRSLSTRSTRSTCRTLFDPFQALAERLLYASNLASGADPPAASCRCYIHPPARAAHQIPIAPVAAPVPNFPRLRAFGAFWTPAATARGRFVMPASKNLVWGLLRQGRVAVLLSHFVTSLDCICGMDSPLLGCASGQAPKPLARAPKARGLTANAQSEPS